MARESEGKVLVATGAEIPLNKPLLVSEKPQDWAREKYHCEPLLRSAGCGGGWG